MSDYTHKYQGVSHQALYDGVMAGEPGQIDGVAAQWTALKGIVDDLGHQLDADLGKLANTWTGMAGQEFQARLSHIVTYADSLGTGMSYVGRGLTMMAEDLRTARGQAESPAETDDHDRALSGAAKGAVFGVPGAVVGAVLGHQQDEAEREKAHQRMVKVVANLAAGYDFSAYDHLVPPPPPDPETPGGVGSPSSTPRGGPGVDSPTAAPVGGGGIARTGGATVAAPDRPASGPGLGSGAGAGSGADVPGTAGTGTAGTGVLGAAPVTAGTTGTSLAGADPLLGGALLGGAVA
ncbi:WXG100 family type VII secretion target, partial [Micromonospora sp. NPDC049799]|uniref:WXG100 family type VII secretion target n=1 Tax=Micromonospora sp. NPDC049799 TaxID=3154741 RepID=UPI0033EC6B51